MPGIETTSRSRPQLHSVRAKPEKSTNGKPSSRRTRARERVHDDDDLIDALHALGAGDFAVRLRAVAGDDRELCAAFNALATRLELLEREVRSVSRMVVRKGDASARVELEGGGAWTALAAGVNAIVVDLSRPSLEVARVLSAVAAGDLSQRMPLEIDGKPIRGEFRSIGVTVNTLVEKLGRLALEVARVAREVGTEGKLGGQARVPGVAGTWKELTDNVNGMAANLTTQVRGIARVVTAVAHGDLGKKLELQAEGEILELARTVNTMVDELNAFAGEVTRVAREVGTEGKLGGQARVPHAHGIWLALTENVNELADNLTRQVRAISEVATAVTEGDLTRSITVPAEGELLALKERVNQMIANLRDTTQKNREQDWLKTNLARFGALTQGHDSIASLSRLVLGELAPLVGASHGAFFAAGASGAFELAATYAFAGRRSHRERFAPGEGLVGQCAIEKKSILLTSVPGDYVRICSGLGEAAPKSVLVVPILFEGEVRAVLELASFEPFGPSQRALIEQLSAGMGVVLNGIAASARTEELLAESQLLARELQAQQEELKYSNIELAQQARVLRESEELLKSQQEELQQVNEELEEKASLLAEQNCAVEEKNREVELARAALEEKAEQLALSARYKSEFLANMSHELRTPLNSLLILARLLADNKDRNLSEKQVEYARTIQASGADLLSLINQVLDLSKIEAGKVEIQMDAVDVGELLDYVERAFRPVAQQKGVAFRVESTPDAPPLLSTDPQRLQQILRNLLGNAFKFTESGEVSVRFFRAPVKDVRYECDGLAAAPDRVAAFAVTDTGIGIPLDKQQLIFTAFQQADGTTSRKYGGTGLGLSISRELSRLLGGEIRVESEVGRGSTFTLFLPLELPDAAQDERPRAPAALALGLSEVPDDRERLSEQDRVLLIVESDAPATERLLDLAHRHGFKGIVTLDGARALAVARRVRPDAVVLDLELRGMPGLEVLERLKSSPDTRHIPVHVLSCTAQKSAGMRLGASAHVETPATHEALDAAFEALSEMLHRRPKSVLVVEDDPVQRENVAELIAGDDVTVTSVGSAEAALELVSRERFDCAVIDLNLPGESGFELARRLAGLEQGGDLPVIVYTSRDLSPHEETELKKSTRSIIVKDARSPGRLLEETALFLHRVEKRLPSRPPPLRDAAAGDAALAGKTVLVVDDDVRNVFALTTVLENVGARVVFAENGRDGLRVLSENAEIDLVLMDVMMPEMDGYDTMREIRRNARYAGLPIIALTAKAMKGDREKCIEAGASDYVTKPVDTDRLLSLVRVWLYTAEAGRA